MESRRLAGPVDLPNELLKVIFDDLPDDTIYNLASTCKDLHFCVLPVFLERNGLRITSSEHISLVNPSKTALRAFGRSLFTQNLRSVSFHPNADLTRLLSDLRTLRRMVAFMPEITELSLRYSSFNWLVHSKRYHDQAQLDVENWRLELAELLDVALAKSCRCLLMYGANHISLKYPNLSGSSSQTDGSLPHTIHAGDPHLGQILPKSLYQLAGCKLLSIFGKPWGNSLKLASSTTPAMRQSPSTARKSEDVEPTFERSIEQLTPPTFSVLTTFHIHSQMLLQPPLLHWTQSRLQLSAATLTDLSLNVDSNSLHTWTPVFSKLNIRALSKFELICDQLVQPTGEHFRNVAAFLARHRSLTSLHLYGLALPCDLSPLHYKPPILPGLTSLTAHPSFVAWFFNCDAPFVYQPFPSVMVSSEFSWFEYDLFDEALMTLASRPETDMKLALRFVTGNGVDKWMQKHVSLGHSKSCLSTLRSVKQLSIHSHHSLIQTFSEEVVKILPSLLALFPSLEDVSFAEQSLWVDQLINGLVKEIETSCPRIKLFSVDALRTGLEEWKPDD
ncbi:hypothetical protein K443DRAFT_683200 [Laccaria amethystina LaAM-08-1]|uniref:F-box domain-containing protein n=1 Tax=Laccaria amethystina LaAM-08-1 TaxID=1095629 RepID=A0A0C9XGE2_9AGAR|nr:hypothetical protein K443DRAFT_683200 [Laccaria amethystina LaAM-08-1]